MITLKAASRHEEAMQEQPIAPGRFHMRQQRRRHRKELFYQARRRIGPAIEKLLAMTAPLLRSEEHTAELQSLMRTSYAVFCLKKKNSRNTQTTKRQKKRNTRKKES